MTSIDPTEPKSTAEEVSDPSPPITDQDQSEPPTPAGDSSESDGGNVSEGGSKEPFANLKLDERHFEDSKKRDQRKAQLVMGPALGESSSGNGKDTVVEGETIAENEEILADLPDDALDLELTHLRLRTLRGLGLQRFKNVEVSYSIHSCDLQRLNTDSNWSLRRESPYDKTFSLLSPITLYPFLLHRHRLLSSPPPILLHLKKDKMNQTKMNSTMKTLRRKKPSTRTTSDGEKEIKRRYGR